MRKGGSRRIARTRPSSGRCASAITSDWHRLSQYRKSESPITLLPAQFQALEPAWQLHSCPVPHSVSCAPRFSRTCRTLTAVKSAWFATAVSLLFLLLTGGNQYRRRIYGAFYTARTLTKSK